MTLFLGRKFPSLQNLWIELPNGSRLVIDLQLLSTHDLLVGNTPEVAEQRVMSQLVKDDMFVVDIGAHVGVHTVFLAALAKNGQVWAFEPQPDCLPVLEQTVAVLPNVRLYPYALSDKKGKAEFYIAKHRPMSGLSNWTATSRKIECLTYTLDELIEEENKTPDFIKCDIEGAELLCFRGARKTLDRRLAPILLFEANEAARGLGFKISEAFDFLSGLENPNYVFFEIQQDGEVIRIDSLLHLRSNILAIPLSKLENTVYKNI